MNYYIESRNTNPDYNLALEQFVFDRLDRSHRYFMLWQNNNSIIVGKHQNTAAEINAAYVNEHNITVVRRLSGGGAVYHDLGNINFTIISDADNDIDFTTFCKPIQKALISFGVPVEISGRNDMTVEGKKFSGNAQYVKQNRIMHHGTILYDSSLETLSRALRVSGDKIESKGIASVQSRVTNIRPYMRSPLSLEQFWAALKQYLFAAFDLREYNLSPADTAAVDLLREHVYSQWSWNYGASPPCNIHKKRRIEGCGTVEIMLDVAKEGIIKTIVFYGDFFGREDPAELAAMLSGRHLEYGELKSALGGIDVSRYFYNLDAAAFFSLLLE